MSEHQQWKMIHLLYGYARRRGTGDRRVLTEQELARAGVHCDPDSREILETAGVVTRVGDEYSLSAVARTIIDTFTVGKGRGGKVEIRVDYPEVFIVMPFTKRWSRKVYDRVLKAGTEAAGFTAVRGDAIVRVGDLSTNVWRSIARAGVIVAEVSVPNPNVYYEIGLADALGKPVFLFKQAGTQLPADLGGVHYYEYDLGDLERGRQTLADALTQWAGRKEHQSFGVQALVDR